MIHIMPALPDEVRHAWKDRDGQPAILATVAPDGTQPIEMRKLDTEAGRLVCSLPIAHNDQTGKWTVTATDVATGKTRTVTVKVKN